MLLVIGGILAILAIFEAGNANLADDEDDGDHDACRKLVRRTFVFSEQTLRV
jgi:hypothetical protein